MNLFTPNTDFYKDYYDKERFLLAWRTSFIFACVFLILSIIFYFLNVDSILPISITCMVGIISTIYLQITKKFKVLFWAYAITGTVMSNFAMNYVMTASHYADLIWILTSILISFIGLGRKVGYVFIIVNAVGVISFYAFSVNRLLSTVEPKSNLGLFGELFELAFAFFVVTYLISKFSEFQRMSQKEVDIANKKNIVKTNENEVLVKEIHHRVKNNLQIIISLLRLQQNEIKSEEAKTHFTEAINRIMVMSLIHQKLYNDKTLSKIKIKDYLTELTDDIVSASALIENVVVSIESEIDKIDLETIVPLGLLVNELMSNSLQHAFQGGEAGEIKIDILKKGPSTFEMTYFDNGIWQHINNDYSSFGTELIGILTSQLDGTYSRFNNNEGTQYTFNLSNQN